MKLQKFTKFFFYLSLFGWFPFMWLCLFGWDASESIRLFLVFAGFSICLLSSITMTDVLSQVDLFKSAEEYNEEKWKFIEARKKLEAKITELTLKN